MTTLFYLRPIPGMALSTQIALAEQQGYDEKTSAMWTDTPKSFPRQRDRLVKAIRDGHADVIWLATLPVIADNSGDLRHVFNELTERGADILEGQTGWRLRASFEEGLSVANCKDYWAKRRKLTDDPRGNGRSSRNGAKKAKMPEALARTIWFDPTISTAAEALEKMNSDPRYRGEWKQRTAYKAFGAHGRPPGARPKSLQPETDE